MLWFACLHGWTEGFTEGGYPSLPELKKLENQGVIHAARYWIGPCRRRRRPSPERRNACGPRTPLRAVQNHPSQRLGRELRAFQDFHRDDQGVHRGERRPRRGPPARAAAECVDL